MEAYVKGYEKDLFGADWTVKDTELLNRVQNNLFSFSAAKSYAEAKEIRDSVYDSNGNIRSRNDFRRACKKVDADYNGKFLDTERQQVMIAGTQGSRWVDIENSADTHPYLEYVTARDERVREEHRALDGTILPIDDPFWTQYYPPNGWRCRCTVRKRTAREYDHLVGRGGRTRRITDSDTAMITGGKNVPKTFRQNVGTSYIFDKDDHPYYKANAAAKAEQMTATKHYGMKSIEQIYQEPKKLADYQGNIKSKEDYDAFWDTMEGEYGEAGKGFTLVDEKHQASATFTREQLYVKLRDIKDKPNAKHPEPQRRWSYFDEILRVFFNPDEVWITFQGGKRVNEHYKAKVYIKYYQDSPMILFLNNHNIALSFYKSDGGSDVERFRNGVLLKKKKR
ncbi:MAG: phage head morphogenesis protein [Bacteroidales bacterium]|nr:phage head morphogenesis protein [Bacteroidales bacterium]